MSQKSAVKPVTLKLPMAHPKQFELISTLDTHPEIRFIVGACGTKFGKDAALTSRLPTPYRGWITVGDLVEGDYIFDHEGKPTLVEYITDDRIPETCYRVTFSDGNYVDVNSEHLWETETHACRKNRARAAFPNDRCKSTTFKPEVRTTQEIKDTLLIKMGGKMRPNHSIPVVSGPLAFPTQELPLDPYVLGAWLGDGTKGTGKVTCDDKELFVVEEVQRSGLNVCASDKDPQSFLVDGLAKLLTRVGALNDKHVPPQYMIGSPEQRLALLQGLMDADGTISKRGDCCFDNTNKALADAVAELAQTLGIKVNREERQGRLNGVDKKWCYRVHFTTDLPVFRLPRKLKRIRPIAAKAKRRLIVSVDPISSVPMKCIRVASPRHLFLIGSGCIPTHNTYGSTIALVKNAWNDYQSLNWWVAPTFSQSKMAYDLVLNLLPDGTYEEYKADLKIVLLQPDGSKRSTIEFKSGDNPNSLRGFGVKFFIMDEAARCPYESYVSLFTTITQTMGRGFFISTPHARNWFYEAYQKGEKFNEDGSPKYSSDEKDPFAEWFSIRMPSWTNPHVPMQAIEDFKKNMPEDVFRQEVGAQFLSDSAGVFRGITSCIRGALQNPAPGLQYAMGVDLARLKDYTVLTVMDKQSRHVVHFERFNQISWELQYYRILEVARRYSAEVCMDSTGIGDPIVETIQNSGVRVVPYKISGPAAKQQLIDKLRVNIEKGRVSFPHIPILRRELEAFEYKVSDNNAIKYSSPYGVNDDCVISLALSNWIADVPSWSYRYRSVAGI